jgi:hypothetical protein
MLSWPVNKLPKDGTAMARENFRVAGRNFPGQKGGARITSNCAVLLAGSVQSFITSNQATYTLSALSRAQPPLLSSMLLSARLVAALSIAHRTIDVCKL